MIILYVLNHGTPAMINSLMVSPRGRGFVSGRCGWDQGEGHPGQNGVWLFAEHESLEFDVARLKASESRTLRNFAPLSTRQPHATTVFRSRILENEWSSTVHINGLAGHVPAKETFVAKDGATFFSRIQTQTMHHAPLPIRSHIFINSYIIYHITRMRSISIWQPAAGSCKAAD